MTKQIICGIYKITSPTGHIYIGQSIDIHKRFTMYRSLQCKTQPRLLTSFKGHGVKSHTFEIIHVCETEELNGLEKYYVELYNSFNTPLGLNLIEGGGSYGKRSDETKRKNSEANTGEKHPQFGKKQPRELVERRNANNRGKKRTPEQIKRLSDSLRGRVHKSGWNHKEATKEKLRNYHNRPEVIFKKSQERMGEKNHRWGKVNSEETRKKISLANTGRKHSDGMKKKLSDARKGEGNPMYGVRLENSGMTGKKHNQSFFELKCKILLNINTGIFYFGFKDAANSIGIKHSALQARLKKQAKVNTQFIIV